MQNIGQRIADGGSKAEQNPDATWWCKLLARLVSIIAALIGLICGFLRCISTSGTCIGAGILEMFAASLILIIEAPCCFQYAEITKPIIGFAEKRSFLQRAIAYGILCIPPVAMCFSPTTMIGCSLMFGGAVLYGIMGLGRKADREDMKMKATGPAIGNEFETSKASLVGTYDAKAGGDYGQP